MSRFSIGQVIHYLVTVISHVGISLNGLTLPYSPSQLWEWKALFCHRDRNSSRLGEPLVGQTGNCLEKTLESIELSKLLKKGQAGVACESVKFDEFTSKVPLGLYRLSYYTLVSAQRCDV